MLDLTAVANQVLVSVDNLDVEKFCLDLRNVRLVSPVTWEVLLRLQRRLLTRGKRLCLCHARPEVSEVLEITKLNRVFDLQPAVGMRLMHDRAEITG